MSGYPEQERADGALPSTESAEYPADDTIAAACRLLAEAKAAEAKATAVRIGAEQALLAFLPVKAEGSVSQRIGQWKVTVTFPMNRTIDAAALEAVRAEVPEALFERAIEYRPSLVIAGLTYLRSNEPETYALLAQAITAKPGKPGVKLEPIN
jgi:hypothetical protein